MDESKKTKKVLVEELQLLHSRIAELQRIAAGHKPAADTPQGSGELYRTLVENINLGITLIDTNHRIIMTNAAHGKLFHKPVGEFIGKYCFREFEKRKAVCSHCPGTQAIATGRPAEVETEGVRDDGSRFAVHIYAYPVFDTDGAVKSFIEVVEDITERKKAGEKLKQYQFMVESAHDAIFLKDLKSRYVIANNKALGAFGLSRDQVIGKNDVEIMLNKDEARKNIEDDKLVFKTGRRTEITRRMTDPAGKEYWFQAIKVPQFDDEGNVIGLIGIARDITRHRRTEGALRESEQKYRVLFDNAADLIVVVDVVGNILDLNERFEEDSGYERAEFVGTNVFESGLLTSASAERVSFYLKELLAGNEVPIYEVEGITKDGRLVPYELKAVPLKHRDKIVAVQATLRDITERKKIEQALRESEERYKALFEGSAEGIIVAEIGTKRFRYANSAMCRLLGYTEHELTQQGVEDIHPEERLPHVLLEFEAQARGEKTLASDIPCLRKDGTVVYADVNTARVTIDGVECNVGFFTDVTERRDAQKALELAEQKYRRLVENLQQEYFFYSHGTNGVFSYVSPSIKNVLGYTQVEFLTHYTDYLSDNPINQEVVRHTELSIRGEQQAPYEVETYHRDGGIRRLEVTEVPVFDAAGRVVAVEGIAHDITERERAREELRRARDQLEIRVTERTSDLAKAIDELRSEIGERKRVEKALRQAEERFRTIFENTVIGLYRTTPDGRILMANPALVKMLGYSAFEELAVRNLEGEGFDVSHPRSDFKRRLESEGTIVGLESTWIRRDRTELFVCESAVAIRDESGKVVCYEGTVEDITERKEAEKKLLEYQKELRSLASELSLAEERLRRRLATDVHDLIGQNLAISKIKLESLRQSVKSAELAGALEDLAKLIGETIDSSRSLTSELSPPVLYELGFEAAVEWLVRRTREQHGIRAEFKRDRRAKPLDHDVRVLLFQAVRELLVNVAKHAQAGHVEVSAKRVGDEIRVSVADDGVGFDKGSLDSRTYRSEGFGLFSIRERLGHIGGRLDIETEPDIGTKVTLVAPIDHKSQNAKGKRK